MSIYEHFRPEERSFIDQVLQWINIVEERYVHKLSDFLDPREQQIVTAVVGKNCDVRLEFFGGAEQSERKRALLYPDYYSCNEEAFELAAFEIVYPQKFVEITHRDLLGSMMGLGLKREKYGDIYIKDGTVQIIVANEIASFVEMNLQKVGRATVKLERILFDRLIEIKEQWLEKHVTVSSMRLDVIIAEVYQLSRSKVVPFIEHKKVKVNWRTIESASFVITNGDYLSVRGFGRCKILNIEGTTKKGKIRLTVGILK